MNSELKDWGTKQVNLEILHKLSLEDNKVKPLPGATSRRYSTSHDERLSNLKPGSVGGVNILQADPDITYYEHVATIRFKDPSNPKNDKFFVAFRQTMDALLLEQQDVSKYPEWLMKDPVKKTELKVFIYLVKCLPRQVPILRSHEDWLEHIGDPSVFDTLAYFLLRNSIITEEMYGRL